MGPRNIPWGPTSFRIFPNLDFGDFPWVFIRFPLIAFKLESNLRLEEIMVGRCIPALTAVARTVDANLNHFIPVGPLRPLQAIP